MPEFSEKLAGRIESRCCYVARSAVYVYIMKLALLELYFLLLQLELYFVLFIYMLNIIGVKQFTQMEVDRLGKNSSKTPSHLRNAKRRKLESQPTTNLQVVLRKHHT